MGRPEQEAIQLFARTEGLLLDPVYTARAAAGLIDLIRAARLGQRKRFCLAHRRNAGIICRALRGTLAALLNWSF